MLSKSFENHDPTIISSPFSMETIHSLLLSHDAKCRHVNLLECKTEINQVAYPELCQTSKMEPLTISR